MKFCCCDFLLKKRNEKGTFQPVYRVNEYMFVDIEGNEDVIMCYIYRGDNSDQGYTWYVIMQ